MDRTLKQMFAFSNFLANITVWLHPVCFTPSLKKWVRDVCFIFSELMYAFPYHVVTNSNISETVVEC